MAPATEQFNGVGRRKTSTARVYLRPGKGEFKINGRSFEGHFGKRPTVEKVVHEPLVAVDAQSKWDVIVTVRGGGPIGQAGAIRHGIARALVQSNPDLRGTLRRHGLLTRDPRMKERKKYGLHKARRAHQFSKR
jgi:small subunit ribosomal protein S9